MADTQHVDCQALGTFTRRGPHPSRGENLYDDPWRGSVVTLFILGLLLDTPELNLLRASHKYPSYNPYLRYIELHQEYGHWQPKIATGNNEAARAIMGQALVDLALFRVVHPEAPISHVRVFLFNMDPTVAPYLPQAVIRAKQLLGLWMKRSSTTCERAYWTVNMH